MARHADLATTELHVPFNAGTSFPGSPATDQVYHRTDRDMVYTYDGTRWLCLCGPHSMPGSQQNLIPLAATATTHRWPVPQTNGGIYVERLQVVTFVTTTNNGTNFWTYNFDRRNAANANTAIGNFTTAADAANTWVDHVLSPALALAPAGSMIMLLTLTTTLAPGTAYALPTLEYRHIG